MPGFIGAISTVIRGANRCISCRRSAHQHGNGVVRRAQREVTRSIAGSKRTFVATVDL